MRRATARRSALVCVDQLCGVPSPKPHTAQQLEQSLLRKKRYNQSEWRVTSLADRAMIGRVQFSARVRSTVNVWRGFGLGLEAVNVVFKSLTCFQSCIKPLIVL